MELTELCTRAKEAKYKVAALDLESRNRALLRIADLLNEQHESLILANAGDIAAATAKGMSIPMVDRLRLTKERIAAISEGMRQVAALPDPLAEVLEEWERPNGLRLKKVRVPLGVIGIIYESRPNVTVDAFALCFKSGNAVILKGGSDALHSNKAICAVIRQGLEECGIDPDVIALIEDSDRETTKKFMQMYGYVDVLIPRGSAGLIRSVVENSRIPVIETGAGNCHVYVDAAADPKKAKDIIINAKTQRLGVCNACESLVIHESVRESIFPMIAAALHDKSVEVRGDEEARLAAPEIVVEASEEDFAKEYLDLLISVKTVKSVEEAIEHINRHSTHHSEAIITEDPVAAEKFLNGVDSACVYVNASTRFTDGFEFGFGAEIGISTQMLHARGPMGLKELTSYKYKIYGNGQVRG
ncbi:MAG: glutamate-5-semialdehyde dehydrogenase [Lachnospiraceae bacterium]|nr:glutamate-5-semialdehyde dehydrogenase [Lachnospiraceae bacterium]